jgi:hypothetical protein
MVDHSTKVHYDTTSISLLLSQDINSYYRYLITITIVIPAHLWVGGIDELPLSDSIYSSQKPSSTLESL